MKMEKASEQDIEAAGDLMALLTTIDSGYYPSDEEGAPTHFDEDDRDHLRLLYDKVKALLDRAPGFHGRVIGGMCYVIMYGKNEIVDPDSDVLELHPRLAKALENDRRYQWLRRKICIIDKPGFMSGHSYAAFEILDMPKPTHMAPRADVEFDAAIDAEIDAALAHKGAQEGEKA